jgi:hypothetical protein
MLFRTNKGELIEINKYNFINDTLYFQKIMQIKQSREQSSKQSNKVVVLN